MTKPRKLMIYVCTNFRMGAHSCAGHAEGRGAKDVLEALQAESDRLGGRVEIRESGCLGYCKQGPNVKILGGNYHHGVTPDDAPKIVTETLAAID